jgi:protein PhnA
METKDSNGNVLNNGDRVSVIKDLKIKGMNSTLKRGTKIKGIRLTDDPGEIECSMGKSTIVLKTQFVKKG